MTMKRKTPMPRFPRLLAALLPAFLLPSPLAAADGTADRFLTLSKCMAYAAVKGGLDGEKPIPPEYAVVIAAIGEEYMFEARVIGMDDDAAHTAVVNELIRQNRIKREQGLDALAKDLGPLCSNLSEEFSGR